MDGFKSLIWYAGCEGESIPFGAFDKMDADMDTDEIDVDFHAWGWENGGLGRLVRAQFMRDYPPREALFFRGAALFSNLDDAKNDYLMSPETDGLTNEEAQMTLEEDCTADLGECHVPFGMVIPVFRDGVNAMNEPSLVLVSITLILFWQELL